jgi:hypothetical protein
VTLPSLQFIILKRFIILTCCWEHSSRVRAPAWQAPGSEFKHQYCQKKKKLTCFIAGDINLDHFVLVVSAQFLYCKATLFPWKLINGGGGAGILWDKENPVSPQTSTH